MCRSLPIDRTTTSPELIPTRIWIGTPCVRCISSPYRLSRALPRPHLGHLGSSAAPQSLQNLASAGFGCPHCGHDIGPSDARRRLRPFLHFDDLVRDQPVRLAVDRCRGLLAGCLDETEHLAGPLVEPVAQIVDTVLVLDLEILLVRVTQRLSLQAVDLMVHIEIEWH